MNEARTCEDKDEMNADGLFSGEAPHCVRK